MALYKAGIMVASTTGYSHPNFKDLAAAGWPPSLDLRFLVTGPLDEIRQVSCGNCNKIPVGLRPTGGGKSLEHALLEDLDSFYRRPLEERVNPILREWKREGVYVGNLIISTGITGTIVSGSIGLALDRSAFAYPMRLSILLPKTCNALDYRWEEALKVRAAVENPRTAGTLVGLWDEGDPAVMKALASRELAEIAIAYGKVAGDTKRWLASPKDLAEGLVKPTPSQLLCVGYTEVRRTSTYKALKGPELVREERPLEQAVREAALRAAAMASELPESALVEDAYLVRVLLALPWADGMEVGNQEVRVLMSRATRALENLGYEGEVIPAITLLPKDWEGFLYVDLAVDPVKWTDRQMEAIGAPVLRTTTPGTRHGMGLRRGKVSLLKRKLNKLKELIESLPPTSFERRLFDHYLAVIEDLLTRYCP